MKKPYPEPTTQSLIDIRIENLQFKIKKGNMITLISDYIRCLDCIGWENEVYLKKGSSFDVMTKRLEAEKSDSIRIETTNGFTILGYNFIYISDEHKAS
jgi:hypothetical protein